MKALPRWLSSCMLLFESCRMLFCAALLLVHQRTLLLLKVKTTLWQVGDLRGVFWSLRKERHILLWVRACFKEPVWMPSYQSTTGAAGQGHLGTGKKSSRINWRKIMHRERTTLFSKGADLFVNKRVPLSQRRVLIYSPFILPLLPSHLSLVFILPLENRSETASALLSDITTNQTEGRIWDLCTYFPKFLISVQCDKKYWVLVFFALMNNIYGNSFSINDHFLRNYVQRKGWMLFRED